MNTTTVTQVVPSALDRLKARLADENSTYISDASGFFTFNTFITIFCKAENECCLNYMEGAAALYRWMTYDQIPLVFPITAEGDRILPILPRLMRSYEMFELIKIISGGRGNYDTMEDYLASIQTIESILTYEILRNAGIIS
jgi:hypothetical protein